MRTRTTSEPAFELYSATKTYIDFQAARIEPRTAGLEGRMQPLCCAVLPTKSRIFLQVFVIRLTVEEENDISIGSDGLLDCYFMVKLFLGRSRWDEMLGRK